jgi:hypothetical protein
MRSWGGFLSLHILMNGPVGLCKPAPDGGSCFCSVDEGLLCANRKALQIR